MRYIFILLFLVTAFCVVHAQEPSDEQRITENGKTYILYRVKAGETLYSIGKRYHVSLSLLTGINPQIAGGLKTGVTLKIPVDAPGPDITTSSDQDSPTHYIFHKVQRKETLYYLSKHYGVSIDHILQYNPGMNQLKKGETLRIPQWEESAAKSGKSVVKRKEEITHVVEQGETLYAISRKYGLPVTAILEKNPEARNLKAGMKLTIPSVPSFFTETDGLSESFQLHTIVAGETLFSISKKYEVSADRLVELNPSMEKHCKAGMVIKIPVKKARPASEEHPYPKDRTMHFVVSGETLFGLSRNYQVPVSEIIRSNPFLETRDPRPGDTIFIIKPDKTSLTDNTPGNDQEKSRVDKTGDCIPGILSLSGKRTYRIALLLPIMINANKLLNAGLMSDPGETTHEQGQIETDSVRNDRKPPAQVQFQGNSENYIHFYEGVLLAVDSLQQEGISVQLDVWDTEQKASRIKTLISSGNLKETDLIIGPVYPNEQKEVFDYASRNKIPVVSPLSSSDEYTRDNPYAFQINPSKEYISIRTNKYLMSTYQNANFVVLQTSSSGNEAENEISKLRDLQGKNTGTATISLCNIRKDGYTGLLGKLEKGRKNILVIPSGNEAEVSVAVSNIKSLVTDFDITLAGNSRFPQFESINPGYYHQGQLEFLTPYWPDVEQPVTRSFVNKFRAYFKTDPNQYSMQGHDITFFFVKALNDFGKDFRHCITSEKAQLVQGTYHFIRNTSGGYFNSGLSVVQYLPTYTITRKMILTE